MEVKAQALIHAGAWLEETHGQDAVARVLAVCSPAVRERYMTAINIEWHPVEELYEWLEAIEKTIGRGDGSTAFQSGAYSARIGLRGMVKRSLFYLGRPEFLLRRITGIWSQYNQEGEMRLLHFDERRVTIELANLSRPNRMLCHSITGWVQVTAEAVGARGARAEHTRCRALGHAQCLYDVSWNAKNAENEAHAQK